MTVKVSTTNRHIQMHSDKNHRTPRGHCRKQHTHGCNHGCKDLHLEQKVCPTCKTKTLTKEGVCQICERRVVFLQPGNRHHQKIMKDKLCPKCSSSLNQHGHCEQCQRTFTVLWKNLGWNPWTKSYVEQKGGVVTSKCPLVICPHHNDYPIIKVGDRAYV